MEGKTLFFVVLSGLCFPPACWSHIYFMVDHAKNWTEALSYCRLKYTDLASFDNKGQMDKLVDPGHKYYAGYLWVGLYDDINSWRWSLEKEGYYGEGETEVRMWMMDKPNNFGGYENCAAMDTDGLWNDKPCNEIQPFVCYSGGVDTLTSSSFIFVNQFKTWKEAQSYCREQHTDLASVRNQTENEQIKKMTQNRPTWIGLYRDSWKWSDGRPVSLRNWNANNNGAKSNSPCVAMHRGQLQDTTCDKTYYFVCEIVQARQQLVSVKVTTNDFSVNLEETLLQQFSETLKEHGLSEDMKLTWRKQPDGKIFYLEEKEERNKDGCNLT